MSDVKTTFSGMVEVVAMPEIDNWVSRNWALARDCLDSIGEIPDDAVLDVIGLLLDVYEEQQAEIERLRTAVEEKDAAISALHIAARKAAEREE